MDFQRMMELAGVKVLAEQKQLNEQMKEVNVKSIALQSKGPGLSGDMINIPAGEFTEFLAAMFAIPKDWKKLVQIGKCYVAYNPDDQMCIFSSKSDYSANEYDDE